ncbi:DUF927 domain-containing protein [Sulfuricystis thermophila]|uniref:DUF927 domain-containing protein n=1 Tax=Sulfuricystis thermophila TaxID=2496847 RepID=UPI00103594B2|nr:DUF927 domain-containing protein [Sulfuricystis thermophila]
MTNDPIESFRAAIEAAGLTPPSVIEPDGRLHRFGTNGKPGDDAGWYLFHADGIPAGVFGDWRTGLQTTWRATAERRLSPSENAALRVKLRQMRETREAAERAGQEEAAKRAEAIWAASAPATEAHGYLARKGIGPHGARVIQSGDCAGWLAVPMLSIDGKLWNIERIAPEKPADGSTDKKGLFHGRRTGCFYLLGNIEGAKALLICEGFATGVSLHEATGLPVAVAFNAGNLEPVAAVLRCKHPGLPMLICGDDDWRTPGNPGRAKAQAAARAVGAAAVFPIFAGERGEKQTDFNDLHQAEGLEAVRRIIMPAVAALTGQGEPQAPKAAAEVDAASGCPFPGEESRPCFVVLDEWTEWQGRRWRPGTYYCGVARPKKDDAPATMFEEWFCSPLHVEAVTHDDRESNFGRRLRFKNSLGRWRTWAMPMELLRGSGEELRGELLAMGVELDPAKSRSYLPAYLQSRTPTRRMRCAMRTGWAGKSFVLPDEVIGPDAAGVIFQSGERGHDEHTLAGTLESWRAEVSALARGNPLLTLAISGGFAGPMLARCNAEGGGLHFVGDSSTGKTTLLQAACSIWGGPNYRRSWRATANGLEGAASLFNDCLLALDEISEADPREVGQIVYAVANGYGKQRASRTGAARSVTRWRCFLLSSGERSIETTMNEGGHRAKAGQSVRLLNVPVAREFGAWDDLHGAASPAAFADAIKRAAAAHHGRAGRAFLERLTHDERDFCALLEEVKGLPMFAAEGGEGQEKRAAARFALIGLAGELATEYGLTGWAEGEAIDAAALAFGLWRSMRGRGNDERRQIAEQVSAFLERHGDGRFSDADAPTDIAIRDRAGWWRDEQGSRIYLFTAEAMREALRGFDLRRALDVLQELGALPAPDGDGKTAHRFRIGGRRMRLYAINPDKLEVAQ